MASIMSAYTLLTRNLAVMVYRRSRNSNKKHRNSNRTASISARHSGATKHSDCGNLELFRKKRNIFSVKEIKEERALSCSPEEIS